MEKTNTEWGRPGKVKFCSSLFIHRLEISSMRKGAVSWEVQERNGLCHPKPFELDNPFHGPESLTLHYLPIVESRAEKKGKKHLDECKCVDRCVAGRNHSHICPSRSLSR